MEFRSTVLAVLGMSLAMFSARDALAQSAAPAAVSLDGHYQGTLVCERMPGAPSLLRAPLDLIVAGTDVRLARPMFNLEGTRVTGTEMAGGTIGGDGKLQLVSRGEAFNATFQASYNGTLSVAGGTFTGTQTWTSPFGSRTRNCNGAFVKTH